ncbi:MAG: TRAP transporter substrate-binding protein, partial [Spirochaetes bacterium]|nr:TRAP transporter substrate-binding protein [Spirochaetota bacterium]
STPLFAQSAAESSEEKVYVLKAGHANAPIEDSIYHVEALKFKELVEKYSDGRITVDIYPSGQLGSDAEMAEYTKTGTQDIFITSLNLLTDHAPRLEVFMLPYMFPEMDKANEAIDIKWDYFNDYIITKANLRLLDLPLTGYRKIMSLEPVMSMEEAQDIKFRLPPSPLFINTFEKFGINPTIIPWNELFTSMQLGTVDAFECDPTVLISARFNEVVKYITDIDWTLQVSVMVMSQKTYAGLPADLQVAVDKAALETREYIKGRIGSILQNCIDSSTNVTFLGRPDDYEVWIEKGRLTWPTFYERLGDGDAALGKQVIETVSSTYDSL